MAQRESDTAARMIAVPAKLLEDAANYVAAINVPDPQYAHYNDRRCYEEMEALRPRLEQELEEAINGAG